MNTNSRPIVITVTEAGVLLGVSRSTAYALVGSGDLESARLRRRCVVPTRVVAERLGHVAVDVWETWRRRALPIERCRAPCPHTGVSGHPLPEERDHTRGAIALRMGARWPRIGKSKSMSPTRFGPKNDGMFGAHWARVEDSCPG